jgi:hypothetical protein
VQRGKSLRRQGYSGSRQQKKQNASPYDRVIAIEFVHDFSFIPNADIISKAQRQQTQVNVIRKNAPQRYRRNWTILSLHRVGQILSRSLIQKHLFLERRKPLRAGSCFHGVAGGGEEGVFGTSLRYPKFAHFLYRGAMAVSRLIAEMDRN